MKTGQEDEAPRAEELDDKWLSRAGTGLTQSNHRCKKFTKFANFKYSEVIASIVNIFCQSLMFLPCRPLPRRHSPPTLTAHV